MTDIVERLRERYTHSVQIGFGINDIYIEAATEIEQLRKALVPFAEAADTLDKEQWDDGSIEGSCAYITAKDCRDARDVLDAIEPHK